MTHTLKPMERIGYPHTCTYRRKCAGTPTTWYEVPFVNRYGNLKMRATTVCEDCASLIRTKYKVEQG